jgi:beta-galactosidase
LVIRDVRDYAQVYVSGALKGTLDRRLGEDSMPLSAPAGAALDILVENSGRVNFAKPLRNEEKGITHSVTLAGRELTGWDVYTIPMRGEPAGDVPPGFAAASRAAGNAHTGVTSLDLPLHGAAYYAGAFTLDSTADTFLDTRGWGKGTVWVNGHQLGRFWGIGPEQTLYVPGPWLKRGRNEVFVFDLLVPNRLTLQGLDHPILNDLRAGDRSH